MADMSLFSAASCSGDRDNRRIFLSENFESVIFFDRKIWQAFFGWLDLSTDFFGYSKQSEGSLYCPRDNFRWYDEETNTNNQFLIFLFGISFNAFWKFLRLGDSAWDFLGVIFRPGTLFWFCWKP